MRLRGSRQKIGGQRHLVCELKLLVSDLEKETHSLNFCTP